jgi:hypothetical protein
MALQVSRKEKRRAKWPLQQCQVQCAKHSVTIAHLGVGPRTRVKVALQAKACWGTTADMEVTHSA